MDSVIINDIVKSDTIKTYSTKDLTYIPEINDNIVLKDKLYTVVARCYNYDRNIVVVNVVEASLE